ncbi:MAG: hypothetical protein K6F71_08825 [Ruminococcus sp.]|uniref:hypothetical protein n=1 Tax=Ruminococcus sp. TaxID=41978 RepID=UPI0025ED54B0|nr:hypothetical protein [Ruminococcus sp.]MCR5540899.1 hypothetical protein [Ruminococcus sp.]
MKEKYEYDTVKNSVMDGLLFLVGLGLIIYLLGSGSELERRTFWILAFISGSALALFFGRIAVYVRFIADENSVTFYRVFRKKIAYSSIKSIDLRTETRSAKRNETRYKTVTYTGVIEIITFHCDDGDHSFACVLIPYHNASKPSGVSDEDIANSKFKRLKRYIEERIPIMSAEKI